MAPALLKFFIIGGPIAGIITSLVPVALACVAMFDYSAKMKVFPEILSKENKHGVPFISLFLVSGIAIAICATGATFGVIMTVFSFVNTLSELPNTLSPIFAHKKYPKSCDNSSVRMSSKLAKILAVITFVICIYLCVQMAMTLDVKAVIGIFLVFIIGYVYLYFRIQFLKKKGINLIEDMKMPYEPWEERENSFK